MEIIKKVVVKQVVTVDSRQKLYNDFTSHKMRLEQECQQFLFEQKKMERKLNLPRQGAAEQFEQEIKNRKEKIKLIDFKIEQLDMLEIGTEIVERKVDALVEVKLGMNWEDKMKDAAIVIKDGIVIRIDE